MPRLKPIDRFWNTTKDYKTHVLWTGRRGKPILFGIGDEQIMIHHVAWVLGHGNLPEGAAPKPACGEELCVLPSHLELVPYARGSVRPRKFSGKEIYKMMIGI